MNLLSLGRMGKGQARHCGTAMRGACGDGCKGNDREMSLERMGR